MKKLLIALAIVTLVVVSASAEEKKNHLKSFEGYPFKLGKAFNEVSLTTGGYKNSNDLKGAYYIVEMNHWREWENAGRNISFLGAFIMHEPGNVGDYDWKKWKIMYQPGLYEILDEHETIHLLLKPRIGVSINRGTEKEENFAYGIYSEADKVFNPLNRVGFILDSLFEDRDIGRDGYINPRIFYERGWVSGTTLMASVGPIWHISPDDTTTGITPALSLRVPLNSDLAVQAALTADLSSEAKTYGAFITISWNDIMHVFQKGEGNE
jgi:hypothetical protein